MADAKNDASTDISRGEDLPRLDDLVREVAPGLAEGKRKEERDKKAADKKKKKEKEVETIAFSMSNNKDSKSRTPAEQANEVVRARATCAGAHTWVTKRPLRVDESQREVSWEPKEAFGDEVGEFEKNRASL